MKTLDVALIATIIAMPVVAVAHPGGLNSEGCHNDPKNGGYHFHPGDKLSINHSSAPPAVPSLATMPRARFSLSMLRAKFSAN